MTKCGAAYAFALAGTSVGTAVAQEGEGPREIAPLLEEMPDNWGRWGEEDELGAVNVLGSDQMIAGMDAVTEYGGEVDRFTLQSPITGEGIDSLVAGAEDPTTDTGDPMFPGRFPARRTNWADAGEETLPLTTAPDEGGMVFADDAFVSPLYIQGATHIDALGHGWYDGQLYNGFDVETTSTAREFENGVDGIENLKGEEPSVGSIDRTLGLGRADITPQAEAGIVGRGVLLDVGRQMGTEGPDDSWLPLDPTGTDADAAITLEDLQATAEAQGTELRERDIVLVRTGAIERTNDPDAEWHSLGEPGLTYSDDLVEWAHEMDIPYMGADNLALERITQVVTEDELNDGREALAGTYVLPLHGAFLRDLGITVNEVMDLSGLAEQCAEDGIYEFLFAAAPLYAEMATGGPINPLVVKATSESDDGTDGDGETNDDGTMDDDDGTMDDGMNSVEDQTGLGVGSALAGIGGAGYLWSRRSDANGEE